MAMKVKSDFDLPVYITESGVDDRNDDGQAPRYLVEHLAWLRRAIRDGADVRGFFYNALTDSYEWNQGTSWKYGLYRVDGNDPTKRRTARRAVATFAAIASQGGVPDELLQRYPIEE
jgi:beta-glucosidase